MKSINHKYSDSDSLVSFINNLELNRNNYSDVLVSVYSGVLDIKVNQSILNLIQKQIPTSKIVGCTTAGEILDNYVLSEQVVITFSLFDKTTLKTKFISADTSEFLVDIISHHLLEKKT
jgi:hypothetical protein